MPGYSTLEVRKEHTSKAEPAAAAAKTKQPTPQQTAPVPGQDQGGFQGLFRKGQPVIVSDKTDNWRPAAIAGVKQPFGYHVTYLRGMETQRDALVTEDRIRHFNLDWVDQPTSATAQHVVRNRADLRLRAILNLPEGISEDDEAVVAEILQRKRRGNEQGRKEKLRKAGKWEQAMQDAGFGAGENLFVFNQYGDSRARFQAFSSWMLLNQSAQDLDAYVTVLNQFALEMAGQHGQVWNHPDILAEKQAYKEAFLEWTQVLKERREGAITRGHGPRPRDRTRTVQNRKALPPATLLYMALKAYVLMKTVSQKRSRGQACQEEEHELSLYAAIFLKTLFSARASTLGGCTTTDPESLLPGSMATDVWFTSHGMCMVYRTIKAWKPSTKRAGARLPIRREAGEAVPWPGGEAAEHPRGQMMLCIQYCVKHATLQWLEVGPDTGKCSALISAGMKNLQVDTMPGAEAGAVYSAYSAKKAAISMPFYMGVSPVTITEWNFWADWSDPKQYMTYVERNYQASPKFEEASKIMDFMHHIKLK